MEKNNERGLYILLKRNKIFQRVSNSELEIGFIC